MVILYHMRQGVSVLGTIDWFVLETSVCGGVASRTSSLEPTRQSRHWRDSGWVTIWGDVGFFVPAADGGRGSEPDLLFFMIMSLASTADIWPRAAGCYSCPGRSPVYSKSFQIRHWRRSIRFVSSGTTNTLPCHAHENHRSGSSDPSGSGWNHD